LGLSIIADRLKIGGKEKKKLERKSKRKWERIREREREKEKEREAEIRVNFQNKTWKVPKYHSIKWTIKFN
jgi:hypothetical protein